MKRKHDPQPPLTWRDLAAWIESEGDITMETRKLPGQPPTRRAMLRITQVQEPRLLNEIREFLARQGIASRIEKRMDRVRVTGAINIRKILHRVRGFLRTEKWRKRVRRYDEFVRIVPVRGRVRFGPRARIIFPEETDFEP